MKWKLPEVRLDGSGMFDKTNIRVSFRTALDCLGESISVDQPSVVGYVDWPIDGSIRTDRRCILAYAVVAAACGV